REIARPQPRRNYGARGKLAVGAERRAVPSLLAGDGSEAHRGRETESHRHGPVHSHFKTGRRGLPQRQSARHPPAEDPATLSGRSSLAVSHWTLVVSRWSWLVA